MACFGISTTKRSQLATSDPSSPTRPTQDIKLQPIQETGEGGSPSPTEGGALIDALEGDDGSEDEDKGQEEGEDEDGVKEGPV